MSILSEHLSSWAGCIRCALHKVRKKVVLCKGTIPCQVLMIGEGPGESEDVNGIPFIGPAGRLLDQIISIASKNSGVSPSIAFSNLVACIPKSIHTKRKNVEPLPEEIASCYPRLDEFIDICSPTLIVCIGDLATKQSRAQHWETRAKLLHVRHPAFILRMDKAQQSIEADRCMLSLLNAFEELPLA